MKKVYLLFILAAVLLTACTPALNKNVSSDDLGCEQVLGFSNLEEYEKFISSKRLPDSFVHWNSVAKLGHHIVFIPTKDFPDRYLYLIYDSVVKDENAKSLELQITQNVDNATLPTNTKYKVMSVTSDMTSMRLIDNRKVESIIIRNGVQYHHQSGSPGGLSTVTWYHDDVKFYLAGHTATFSSPLYDRMVSISETEAATAFEEFHKSIDAS